MTSPMQGKERFKLTPAAYLFLWRGNEVLLMLRANTGYQDGKYYLPSGHLEGDELASEAMIREAKEEVGIDIAPKDLTFVHVAHRLGQSTDNERVDFFYEARTWSGEVINAEPNKCDDVAWFLADALPDNVSPFIKRVLADVQGGKAYSEYTEEPK